MKRDEIERISPVATKSNHSRLLLLDCDLAKAKADDARHSARKREIHAIHTGNDDTLQRMLNAIQPGSYITPHRHQTPPKAESIILLQGSLGYVPFNDDGNPINDEFALLDLKRGAYGLDSRAGVWHTFFALEPDTVLFEVKPGPYDASTDKDFARWAPAESDPTAREYLMRLEDEFRKIKRLPPREWR